MGFELREVRDGDLAVFFENQREPEGVRMVGSTPRDAAAFAGHWESARRDAAVITRTILSDGQVAGNIGSFPRGGKREVGYWIGRAYWGKGVATWALAAFLAHDSSRPLHGVVRRENVASARVLEKCGFVREGELRETAADRVPGTLHVYVLA